MPAAERPSVPDPQGRTPGTPTVIPSLPLLVEPMIGRVAEANRLSTHISETRLVTICGPGGVGKTLLATHVASAVSGDFEAVVFVPLATESDAAQIVPSIASHAGLYVADTRTAHQAVVDTFAGMRALVVLDNLEQLLGDVAGVLTGVLRACPRVHLLATSRVTTGVKGEVGFELDPLAVPPPSATSARAVRDADAVKLLLQEVHRQDPDFAVTTQNASAVAEVVRRLDGLPLAIELAAPRLRVLSVDELLVALDARFDVLCSGHAVRDERHRALAATIEWSYRLLGVDEQRLLRYLSVFGAGFPFEAAVHITGEPDMDVLTRLDRLLEHHLVVREAGPPPGALPCSIRFGTSRCRSSRPRVKRRPRDTRTLSGWPTLSAH